MSIQVETKDCTSISDAELAEMADLCAEREPRFDIGFLSKQREEWVLVTRAREGTKLRGYSFSTLERIGGTPSLLIGLATVDRTSRSDTVLRAMMGDKYRRALLAFPDEDVLVGTRLLGPDGFKAFAGLTDVVPRRPRRRPARSVPGDAAWPSASGPTVASTTAASWSRATAARPADSTSPAPSPSRHPSRHLLRVGRLLRRRAAWSPSGGPWPRTSPPANSDADPAPGRPRLPAAVAARRCATGPGTTRRHTPAAVCRQ